MVSSFDAIAWIDHGPSREVAMLKIFRSSKVTPEKGMSAALPSERQAGTNSNPALSFSGEDHPNKATAVLIGFMDTIFKEGAHNWSAEEREKRVDVCLAEVGAIRRAEDKQDSEDISRKLRQQIEVGEFDTDPSNKVMNTRSSEAAPHRPQIAVHEAIKELAESIDFN